MITNKQNSLYIYTCTFLLCLFISALFHAHAQEAKLGPRVEVEADPLAYVFKGYSIHTAVTYSGFRSSVGVFGIEPPKFFLENKAFSVFTSGFDVKTDYLFGSIKGFYAGLQLTYSKERVGLKDAEYRESIWGLNIGVRTGYRFLFGKAENNYKGFYLTPWIALMYAPDAKTIQHGTQEYQQSSWAPFPTVHVGWRF
ncbi:hypothetical protein [Olivibacter sitiensis]|uniref:hypothetical protein n=1 Tax=Olivibacter sitiensis TaxID=376470 RepID=UPI0003FAE9A1|nr:hypothetical protein [Olivibacter sitiensis]